MICLNMRNATELLTRQDYETRYTQLSDEKQKALREVVLAKRNEIFEKLRAIVTAEPFSVAPAELEKFQEDRPNPPSPELAPVLEFYLELGRIEALVSGTRERFWPYEGNWKHEAESFHAAIPDTDTRNPTLAAISDTFNPQILENDIARLRSIMHAIDDGVQEIELTEQEQERLFLPLSGVVRGKFDYVSSFSIDQLLQRKLLTPAGGQAENGNRTFRIESPAGFAEMKVQLRRMDPAIKNLNVYHVRVPNEKDNENGFYFHIQVPKDLEPLWQSLFDRRTQKLIRIPDTANPYDHPLTRTREGAVIKMPVLLRDGMQVPLMHKDAQVIAPESQLLEREWLRAHLLTQNEIERGNT